MASICSCSKPNSLNVVVVPWIGYESVHIAQNKEWLSEDVSIKEVRFARDYQTAFKGNEANAGGFTLDGFLRTRNEGTPLTIVAIFDVSAGADVILAKPEIKSLAELQGKIIGLEFRSISELLLFDAAQRMNFDHHQIISVNIPPINQISAWKNNIIDAAVTYEPVASHLKSLGAIEIYNSRQMSMPIFDVFAVRTDILDSHEDQIAAFLDAHFRSLDYLRVFKDDAIYRIAKRQGVSVEYVRKALADIALLGVSANRNYLSGESLLMKSLRQTNLQMFERRQLTRPDDLVNVIDDRFVRTLQRSI